MRKPRVALAMRHRFHSICPYFAMFPEAFAEKWIARLTRPGETVLDPFSGRGTTAFQALLMGRQSVACDVNEVAYCVTKAKTNAPILPALRRRITTLERGFDGRVWCHEGDTQGDFFRYAFARKTLQQLVYLRHRLRWQSSNLDAMVAALVLGSLHGERGGSGCYLSNQMPRTISTKPAYSIRFWKKHGLEKPPERDVFEILRNRAAYRYESPIPSGNSTTILRDMRELPWMGNVLFQPIRVVITSPPYFDVTNFEEDQWLRLWFLGGPPYPTRNRLSRDDRYTFEDKYWGFIADMWRSLGRILPTGAHVVIRIGSSRIAPARLHQMLTACSLLSGRAIESVSNEISTLRHRQTDAFRPGSRGVCLEVDSVFRVAG